MLSSSFLSLSANYTIFFAAGLQWIYLYNLRKRELKEQIYQEVHDVDKIINPFLTLNINPAMDIAILRLQVRRNRDIFAQRQSIIHEKCMCDIGKDLTDIPAKVQSPP